MCVIKIFLLPVNHKMVDDFGNPDGVGVVSLTPGEIAGAGGEPFEQGEN
jgi:hypothetical protein